MTIYAIFDPTPGRADLPVPVAEKFNWLAALLPPVFLLRHGMWLATFAWVLGVAALVLLAPFVGEAVFWLYVLAAAWLGFAASDLIRRSLLRRGWVLRGERIAASAELAQLEALR